VAFVLGIVVPVYLVIATIAFCERPASSAANGHRGRWQFTLGTLLMLMLLVAVPLGTYRTSGGGQVGTAVAISAVQAVIVGVTCWRFRRCHRAIESATNDLG
jgi:ABC-type proline/glycine betaine transport system permease subunit